MPLDIVDVDGNVTHKTESAATILGFSVPSESWTYPRCTADQAVDFEMTRSSISFLHNEEGNSIVSQDDAKDAAYEQLQDWFETNIFEKYLDGSGPYYLFQNGRKTTSGGGTNEDKRAEIDTYVVREEPLLSQPLPPNNTNYRHKYEIEMELRFDQGDGISPANGMPGGKIDILLKRLKQP